MGEAKSKGDNVFSVRNFRLVFFGALVSEIGAVLYSFAVGFYILEITDNNAFLQGLYLALCGVTLLLFTPVGGVLGDRFHKARIMSVCDFLKGGLILLAILPMVLFPQPKAHVVILFVVGVAGNAVSGIFNPASAAMLPNIVEEDRLQQANAYFSVKNALESIFGVVLAGVLYAALPIRLLFAVVGICYLLSGISEMFIRYAHVRKEERLTLRAALSDLREGVGYLRGQKAILTMMGAALFLTFFFSPIFGNYIPFFVRTDLAQAPSYLFDRVLTPELWSSVFSVLFGVSSLAASVLLSARPQREKNGRRIALRICGMAAFSIVLTAAYWLLVRRGASLNAYLLLLGFGFLLIGLLLVFINVPLNTVIMRIVDKNQLSKVSSITSTISQGLIPISSVLAGLTLQNLGSTILLAICSAGLTVTAVSLLFSRSIRSI